VLRAEPNANKRLGHLGGRRDDRPGRRSRKARQHAVHFRQGPKAAIGGARHDHQHNRRPEQSDEAGESARNAAHPGAEYRGEIDDIRSGQKLAQRQEVVELLRRHPTFVFNQHPSRPRQHATEAGYRDAREGEKQSGAGRPRNREDRGGVRPGMRNCGRRRIRHAPTVNA
jgi:hypothetical protein